MPLDRLTNTPALEAHLLGRIDFQRCLALQQRLVSYVAGRADGQVRLLLCEHPNLITVGRGGSPAEIKPESGLLTSGRLEVRWVKRGGGCLVHAPGQLAAYPILPLRWYGFSVGEYLDRFQTGIIDALGNLGIRGTCPQGRHGVWGRTGQLAAFGVAVRDWVTYHGAFINVCPPMGLFRLVETGPQEGSRMSCLLAERGQPVRMTSVRAEVMRGLSEAFGCDRHHVYSGHPWLHRDRSTRR